MVKNIFLALAISAGTLKGAQIVEENFEDLGQMQWKKLAGGAAGAMVTAIALSAIGVRA